MATSFDHCGICTSRHVSKPSVVWCPDCDEGLCQDCTEHHSLSKATRNHTTVLIDEYHKLPSFIANINLHCDEHDEKYLLFCKNHNAMLCRKCVISENHAECKEIFPVEDVIQNAKTSVAFTEIESSFQEMNDNLKRILEDRQKNVSSLSDSKLKIQSEITAIRRQMNQHLDKIQDCFIAELNKAVENSTQQIQSFIASLMNSQREIDECIEHVENIKKYATDMQTYIGTSLLEIKLNKTENDMQSWIKSGSLAHTVVSFKINTVLNNIQDEIAIFGKPVLDVQSCKLSLLRKKEGQAQLMKVNVEPKTIEHITLTLKTKIKISALNVSGCCILPCGKLVVVNHIPSYLLLLSPDGKIEKQITNIMSRIYDVAYINNETVAVVSDTARNINLVSLTSEKTCKTIETPFSSCGITRSNGNLIISPDKRQLQLIKIEDTTAKDIGSDYVVSTYVASIGNILYSVKRGTNSIVCHNGKGDELWTFENETILKDPKCITADEHGNVFVAGSGSNNVVAIAYDGKKHKIILSMQDLCGSPWAIDYNIELKSLLVVNEKNGQAFLYSVNYA